MTLNVLAQIQPSHWFVAALAVAVGTILYRSQRKARESVRRVPALAGSLSQSAPAMLPSADKAHWEVEMHELARELSARIDSKLAVLEKLMRAAHHESLRLEAAIAQAAEHAEHNAMPKVSTAVEFQPSSNQARRLEEQTHRHPQSARLRLANAADRPYARIYALADRGCDAQAIAEQLPCPIGEVELILSLRQRSETG